MKLSHDLDDFENLDKYFDTQNHYGHWRCRKKTLDWILYLHVNQKSRNFYVSTNQIQFHSIMWLNEIVWEFKKSFVHLNMRFMNSVVRNRVGGCDSVMVLCSQFRQWQPWTEKTSAQLHKHFLVLRRLDVRYMDKQLHGHVTWTNMDKQLNYNVGWFAETVEQLHCKPFDICQREMFQI